MIIITLEKGTVGGKTDSQKLIGVLTITNPLVLKGYGIAFPV